MQLTIRDAITDDATQLSGLLAELGYDVTPEQVINELAAQPGTSTLVAETPTGLVGLVVTNTRRQLHKAALVTTIDALVVTAEMRSQRIGQALVEAAAAIARQHRATLLDLNSRSDRTNAHRFYERIGFDRTPGNHFAKTP